MAPIITDDFNDLWLDSWLESDQVEQLQVHLSQYIPGIVCITQFNPTRKGPDGGRDYAAVIQHADGTRDYKWIDVKQPGHDNGTGMLCCAILASPYSSNPGWAINPDSQTDYVVWRYRDTGRFESFEYGVLRKTLTLRLKEAFKESHFNLLPGKYGRKTGGALIIEREKLVELAESCANEQYDRHSLNIVDFNSIREWAKKNR